MTKAEAGRLGGLTTLQRYGMEHYRKLGVYLPHTHNPTLAEILDRDSNIKTKEVWRKKGNRELSLAAQQIIQQFINGYI